MVLVLSARPELNWFIHQLKIRITPCSVPQGFVLDPLLFLLYIDIYSCSNKLTFYLFAHTDDTNILYADKNLQLLEQIVNTELHISLTSNKLTLNIKKSNSVIFCPYQKRLTFQPIMSTLDSEIIRKSL